MFTAAFKHFLSSLSFSSSSLSSPGMKEGKCLSAVTILIPEFPESQRIWNVVRTGYFLLVLFAPPRSSSLFPIIFCLWKVDRVLANHSLSSTASQGTSNIPVSWFLLLGCYRQARTLLSLVHSEQKKVREDIVFLFSSLT